MIQIIPVRISADVKSGDELVPLILDAVAQSGQEILDGDILVVAHKIVSKAEGRIVDLRRIKPSKKAAKLGKEHGKDPRLAEIILRESIQILRARSGIIVSETRHGLVCANAGVDQSNTPSKEHAILLPLNPDRSAQRLHDELEKRTGRKIAVIMTDTFGRPFRNGQVNVAIGTAGIKPIKSYIGAKDMYGRTLRVTEIAVADEIASAAELVMGKVARMPAAIVRGYGFEQSSTSSTKELVRPKKEDFFR
ncbi:MAG: coenzyme F420-0:L-glutamate ligase [Nitrososphaera sp.]